MASTTMPEVTDATRAMANLMSTVPIRRTHHASPVNAGPRHAIVVQPETLLSPLTEILRATGYTTVDSVPSLEQLLPILDRMEVALVIFPVLADAQRMGALVQAMRRHPQLQLIATAPQKDADVVLRAMRLGISEFLVSPIDPTELQHALHRLEEQSLPAAHGTRQLIAVYGARGGIGVSTVATSLAWLLGQRASGATPGTMRSALVEFSTSGDGVRALLNVDPPHDLSHLAWRPDQWDAALVESVVYPHAERVALLLGARDPAQATTLDSAAASRLLSLMRSTFEFVVVDTDHHLTDQTSTALELADRIVLVTQRELGALRSTKRMLELFLRQGIPADHIHLVVNRVSPRDRITRGDVVTVLGHAVNTELPNDYALCERALAAGSYVPLSGRATPLAAALQQLADTVAGIEPNADAPSRRPRLASFWARR